MTVWTVWSALKCILVLWVENLLYHSQMPYKKSKHPGFWSTGYPGCNLAFSRSRGPPFTQSSKEEKEAPREGSFLAPQFASVSWEGRRCLLSASLSPAACPSSALPTACPSGPVNKFYSFWRATSPTSTHQPQQFQPVRSWFPPAPALALATAGRTTIA